MRTLQHHETLNRCRKQGARAGGGHDCRTFLSFESGQRLSSLRRITANLSLFDPGEHLVDAAVVPSPFLPPHFREGVSTSPTLRSRGLREKKKSAACALSCDSRKLSALWVTEWRGCYASRDRRLTDRFRGSPQREVAKRRARVPLFRHPRSGSTPLPPSRGAQGFPRNARVQSDTEIPPGFVLRSTACLYRDAVWATAIDCGGGAIGSGERRGGDRCRARNSGSMPVFVPFVARGTCPLEETLVPTFLLATPVSPYLECH